MWQWKGGGGVEHGATSAAAALDLLADIYERVKEEVSADCKFVSSIVSAADSGLHGFQFLAGGVLREVHHRLQEARPGAFSPGRPSQFLLNYRASLRFLDFLEGFCSSEGMLQGFRSHQSYEEFLRAWNLSVYFAARFRGIAGKLDEALAPPPPQHAHVHGAVRRRGITDQDHKSDSAEAPQPPPLALHASVALHHCLFSCWSPEVLIPSIAHKFLRLTLQLLSRFGGWVKAGIGARQAGSAAEQIGGEWGLAATPDDFVAVWHDVESLSACVESSLVPVVLSSLGPLVEPALREEVSSSIVTSARDVKALGAGLAGVLADVIGEKCIEVLRPVRAIAAMYRVPSRPPPTRHSHYVPGVLQPLKAVLADGGSESGNLLTVSMRQEIIRQVLEKTTSRFHELAREVVATAKRTESSLKLLQQRSIRRPDASAGVAAGAGGGPAFSDTEKIMLQLFLDVQEYGSHMRAQGVDPSSISAYVALWQCVAPADRQSVDI